MPRRLHFDESRRRVRRGAVVPFGRSRGTSWLDSATVRLAALLAAFASVVTWNAVGAPGMTEAEALASSPATLRGALSADLFACTVTGVHDGDGPIYCREGMKVRLSAIAARETDGSCRPGHPCPAASAEAATAELRRLADGQLLTCEKTGTSYGRVTAWCWRADGIQLNCAMVESGTAARWARYDPAGRLCRGPRPA